MKNNTGLNFSNRRKLQNIDDTEKVKLFDEMFANVEGFIKDTETILKGG